MAKSQEIVAVPHSLSLSLWVCACCQSICDVCSCVWVCVSALWPLLSAVWRQQQQQQQLQRAVFNVQRATRCQREYPHLAQVWRLCDIWNQFARQLNFPHFWVSFVIASVCRRCCCCCRIDMTQTAQLTARWTDIWTAGRTMRLHVN